MNMNMMKIFTVAILLALSNVAQADLCAVGRVVEVSEGFNDRDDLLVKIDYNVAGAQQPPADRILLPDEQDNDATYWFKYNIDNVDVVRLKRIRTLAYLALANGNTVKLISRWNGEYACLNLHQLTILSSFSDPNL